MAQDIIMETLLSPLPSPPTAGGEGEDFKAARI
jgi:hypothetical protein